MSVIVPAYRPAAETNQLVDSLLRQTLAPGRFEVVMCLNGPHADEARSAYCTLAADAPFRVRVVQTSSTGTAHALNLGIASAVAPWVTFVDDDDALSPTFLEGLLDLAAPNVVPLANVVDRAVDGSLAEQSVLGRSIAELAGRTFPAAEFARGLGFNAAKLVPTAWAIRSPHPAMRSGHDVAFFGRLYARHEFSFAVPPLDANVTYFRTLTPLSLSRRLHDRTFAVDERLAVAAALQDEVRTSALRKHAMLHTMMRSQARFTKDYLAANPEAQRPAVAAAERHRLGPVWWSAVNDRPTSRLVVSTCFAPFNDPSAVTVAKRIREWGELVDVVALDLSAVRRRDDSLTEMVAPYLRSSTFIEASTVFGDARALEEFAALGWRHVTSSLALNEYEHLYSRAMWPASHVLAAMIKLERPSLHWAAEFSDSLSRTVDGALRPGPPPDGMLMQRLLDRANDAAGAELPARTIFELAESVAYAFADRVVFTNHHQREYMLGQIDDDEVREWVWARSSIEPQPIPEPHLYHAAPLDPLPPSPRIRLAYFGTFYANRSVGDVIDALDRSPIDLRSRLELHLYTPPSVELSDRLDRCAPGTIVRAFAPLDYLSFLRRTALYDCLLVADARTVGTHSVNPFLPSKYSDYRGSGRPVWALVEPRSTLATLPADFQSTLGDPDSAQEALLLIARELRPDWVRPVNREVAVHG